jgi:hypothetical protein
LLRFFGVWDRKYVVRHASEGIVYAWPDGISGASDTASVLEAWKITTRAVSGSRDETRQ